MVPNQSDGKYNWKIVNTRETHAFGGISLALRGSGAFGGGVRKKNWGARGALFGAAAMKKKFGAPAVPQMVYIKNLTRAMRIPNM